MPATYGGFLTGRTIRDEAIPDLYSPFFILSFIRLYAVQERNRRCDGFFIGRRGQVVLSTIRLEDDPGGDAGLSDVAGWNG